MFPFEINEFLSTGGFIETHRGQVIVFSGEWQGLEKAPDLSKPGSKYSLYKPGFFSDSPGGWYQAKSSQLLDAEGFWSFFQSFEALAVEQKNWMFEDKETFSRKFDSIQEGFKQGLEKVVPVVTAKSEAAVGPSELKSILSNLAKVSTYSAKSGYSYGFWSEGHGVIGRTPEVLLRADLTGETPKYSTMALAGTALAREKRSLRCDKKEMHEHQLVIDDIVEQFEVFGKPVVSETREVKAGSLKHLRTDIDLESNEATFENLVSSLHPTPALGIRPRSYAYAEEFLKSLCDLESRDGFGAPFAVVGDDHPIALVAIRNIHWAKGKTFLCSGCGIVPESQLEKEWVELQNKRSSVLEMLGLAVETVQANRKKL